MERMDWGKGLGEGNGRGERGGRRVGNGKRGGNDGRHERGVWTEGVGQVDTQFLNLKA